MPRQKLPVQHPVIRDHRQSGHDPVFAGRHKRLNRDPNLGSYNVCSYTFVMTMQFKLKAIGNSVGLIIPKEELARLGVGKGDMLTGVAKANGLELRVSDPEFERQMAAADRVMKRHKNALREPAK
jgi:putative addiction module antidote